MSAKIEKLKLSLAEAKDIIRALKEEKRELKAEFKAELKEVKSSAKPKTNKTAKPVKKASAKKTSVKKTPTKKTPAATKSKTPVLRQDASTPEVVEENLGEQVALDIEISPSS